MNNSDLEAYAKLFINLGELKALVEQARERAAEIERLRDERDAADETVVALRKELDAAHDRIAHLERVVAAADAMRRSNGRIARLDAEEAYDAARKGEG